MNLAGVFAPVPTPFDEDDRLDLSRLRSAFRRWLASPLTGFVVLGTNGEIGLMSDEECDRVIDTVRSVVPEERPLIAGAGRESTEATIRAVRRAGELGADAVLVRTPAFFKALMDDAAFVQYYTAVADASPVPVLLYNFTAATGITLRPSAVAALAPHPNIAGIKESGSDIGHIADLVSLALPEFRVLSGSASIFSYAVSAGVSGGILALAGLLPEACVRLFELARSGRLEEARVLQRRVLPVARLISSGYGVPGLKAALALTGCDVGFPRRPLAPAPEAGVAALRDALARFEEVTA